MKIESFRKIIILLWVLEAVWVLMACSAPAGLSRLSRLSKEAVVVAFGDSITFGTGASPQESYPAVLEQLIDRRVVNAGIPGEVTSEALVRLPEVLEQEKPALIIICLGGNDFLRRLNRAETTDNIRQMVRLCRRKNVEVILIAVPALGLSVRPAPLYRDIAEELKVPLEEKTLSEILADNSRKADLIHPNAAGYISLAESVKNLLKKSGAVD